MGTLELDPRILELLEQEANEHLQTMGDLLLSSETGSGTGRQLDYGPALRGAHSLKGTCAAAGLARVEALLHAWESCVQLLEKRTHPGGTAAYDLLHRILDEVQWEIQVAVGGSVPERESESPTSDEVHTVFGISVDISATEHRSGSDQGLSVSDSSAAPTVSAQGSSLKVALEKADRLMANVEELVQVRASGNESLEELHRISEKVEMFRADFGRFVAKLRAESPGRMSDSRREVVDQMGAQLDGIVRGVTNAETNAQLHAQTLSTLSDRLQDDIRAVRMVPVAQAFSSMPRIVRDLGRRLDKQVSMELRATDVEMDRDLVEAIRDPILHIVRNAVAHGIESPEQREANGKVPTGRIVLVAHAHEGGLVLGIGDDGRGVDVAKLRERAVDTGPHTKEEVSAMSDREAVNLVFQQGLSTAGRVDEIAGRGVGLDVVREAVERCGGTVSVESSAGVGTEFRMRLPVNLATVRLMIVKADQRTLAIPVNAIVKILRIRPEQVRKLDSGFGIELDGKAVQVARLGQLLGIEGSVEREGKSAIVVTSGAERLTLVVDAIVGERELVMKSLGEHLVRVEQIAGATVLSDGEIVPVVNVADVIRKQRISPVETVFGDGAKHARIRKRILVVDDSITTRTLEKSILEAVGYEVEVATDGEDAVEKLDRSKFDAVLSDVQMPKMDGIELVRRIRQREEYTVVPLILVSSLDADEDKRRGLDAGADAYLGKKEFRQEVLLATLERLL